MMRGDDLKTEIERRVLLAMPDALIELRDLTGGGDHWQAVIVSTAFEGQNQVARQRAVYSALGELMEVRIHALALKTLTPSQVNRT
ncbi:MAG: BolA family transcriptional regulator [Myxococcales bacterium]|nr:BolA family transcriptional regulator [Myxococcales bacterium]